MTHYAPLADWLIMVGRKLRDIEGDHMVASTKLVKALRPLEAMHAKGETPGYAAHIVSQETNFPSDGDYSK